MRNWALLLLTTVGLLPACGGGSTPTGGGSGNNNGGANDLAMSAPVDMAGLSGPTGGADLAMSAGADLASGPTAESLTWTVEHTGGADLLSIAIGPQLAGAGPAAR